MDGIHDYGGIRIHGMYAAQPPPGFRPLTSKGTPAMPAPSAIGILPFALRHMHGEGLTTHRPEPPSGLLAPVPPFRRQ